MIQRSTESIPELQLDELIHRFLQQLDEGQTPDRAAMLRDNPHLAAELAEFFDDHDRISRFALDVRPENASQPTGSESSGDKSSADSATGGLPRAIRYFGRYEIIDEIARGGMGVVYRARQTRLDRIVALKMILSGRLASAADVSRFQSEAQAAAKLEHPGIVPIYEVGHVAGQHYFSMAYVDGESLAARVAAGPLPQHDAAQIVCQLCDAVQYAHQHGVIHRDLKPANVLIDGEGRVRITDFGLAKQTTAGGSLTATGEILGTPSYMPPEQAAGDLAAAGPAADIYSLGAILYATLTGRPPFQAATPAETVFHVRNSEPAAPRSFNPRISRDLETICLKCLEKAPSVRYATAAAVSEDLRRFLHDEPILARRIGPIRRGGRWIKKRRKFIAAIAASAVIAAGGVAAAFFATRSHDQAAIGTLALSTSGPNLVAEVLDKNGQPAAPAFSVPTSQPVELDAGAYRLRVSSPGLLSEDHALEITAGAKLQYGLRLERSLLWPPVQLAPDEVFEPMPVAASLGGNAAATPIPLSASRSGTPVPVPLSPGGKGVRGEGEVRNNILIYRPSDRSLRLIDGATGKPCWPHELAFDESNLPAGESLDEWTKLLPSDPNSPSMPGWALAPDGGAGSSSEPTIVVASRAQPALVAVSAKTGNVQWLFRGEPHHWPDDQGMTATGTVIGLPLIARPSTKSAVASAAGPVVVACFFHPSWKPGVKGKEAIDSGAQAWFECIALKTGKSIWRYDIANYSGDGDLWQKIPWSLASAGEPRLALVSGRQIVISAVDQKLYGLDLASGKDAFPPFDLGFQPDAPGKLINDGSAAPLAIFASGRKPGPGFSEPQTVTLSAIALLGPTRQWQSALEQISPYSSPMDLPSKLAEFEIEPIGPHGEPTVVAPSWHFDPKMWSNQKRIPNFNLENGYSSLAAFDIQTGKPKWDFPLIQSVEAVNWRHARWILGPDLNADGYRDLFAAWVDDSAPQDCSLVVAAISGRDGKQLWRWEQTGVSYAAVAGADSQTPQAALSWWAPTVDGAPSLVVPFAHSLGGQPKTYVFNPSNGHVLHTISGVGDASSVRLSGSGMPDLLYSQKSEGYSQLMAARGRPPTLWRPLADGNLSVVDDLDGDGIADVIDGNQAVSGRDGHKLFEIERSGMAAPISTILPAGATGKLRPAIVALNLPHDLRGEDLVAWAGSDGHEIWRSSTPPFKQMGNGFGAGGNGFSQYHYPALGGCQLDRSRPDVWVAEATGPFGEQARLTMYAGDTGKLRFQTQIAPGQFGINGQFFRDEFQDLNGDGVRDIVVWVPTGEKKHWQLKALSGADGKPFWPDAPPVYLSNADRQRSIDLPPVGDLEGKGTSDIVFVRSREKTSHVAEQPCELVCVDGRSGRVKWAWPWLNLWMPETGPLLVDFDGSGQHAVCMFINQMTIDSKFSNSTQPHVVILDGEGRLRKRTDIKRWPAELKSQLLTGPFCWQKASIGDGKEVLLVDSAKELRAVGGTKLETRWRWPLAMRPTGLMEVFAPSPSKPATIALAIDSTVLGISAATGKPIWRGETVPDANGEAIGPHGHVLLENEHSDLPLLLTREGCRQVWPADANGRYEYPLVTAKKN